MCRDALVPARAYSLVLHDVQRAPARWHREYASRTIGCASFRSTWRHLLGLAGDGPTSWLATMSIDQLAQRLAPELADDPCLRTTANARTRYAWTIQQHRLVS